MCGTVKCEKKKQTNKKTKKETKKLQNDVRAV